MKKSISLFLSIIMVLSLVACSNNKQVVIEPATETTNETEVLQTVEETTNEVKETKGELKEIFDYVFEIPTYHSIDYVNAENFFQNNFDGWDGACTAVAKYTDDGKMIVGRNMDLYISHKPAYIIRTDVEGDYKTIALSYFHKNSPDYEEVKQNGIPDEFATLAPFLCTDVFNEKGLYVETNMRNGEYWSTGASEYGCTGTNPSAPEKVCSMVLPRYLGQHCATVKEAVEFVKTLNIYTPNAKGMDWNFCFMLADATGDYGILEIAKNQISWLDKEPAQANFYLTKEFQATEDLAAGVGRYQLVVDNKDNVKNENDMYDLIRRVSYSKIYDPANCEFDVRSEFVALKDYLTYDVMTNDEIKEEVYKALIDFCEPHFKKSRKQLQDECTSWESTFTEVVNCSDKTWTVRFFEDENRKTTLSFD